jgi:DUF4097 and DUF4098 domain-containing protein YvlB
MFSQKSIFIFTLFLAASAIAAPVRKVNGFSEGALSVERGTARRLFILGFAGQVTVTPTLKKTSEIICKVTKYLDPQNPLSQDEKNESLNQLTITASSSQDTIELRAVSSYNRADWVKWIDERKAPLAKLEIQAPSNMNLEIYLMHGDVKVSNWKSNVTVTSQNGSHFIGNVDGDVVLKTMQGSSRVEDVRGAVIFDGFSSTFTGSNITGKLTLKTFSGETRLKKIAGQITLSSQKAVVTTTDTNGALTIQNGAAGFHIKDHRGAVTGASESGVIDVAILGPVNAKLSSVTGALTLRVPHSSEAYVSLSTDKGNLNAPSAVESKRSPTGKTAKGRLGGKEPGSLHLTSESGDVSLKYL